MPISREPDQEKGIGEKRGFFRYFLAVTKGFNSYVFNATFHTDDNSNQGFMKWTSLLL